MPLSLRLLLARWFSSEWSEYNVTKTASCVGYDATGNSSNLDANIQATVDAITLLAEAEIFASRNKANQYEQNHLTQMAYYANGNSITRYKHNATSTAIHWWLASPRADNNSTACRSVSTGAAGSGTATQGNGLAPAFKT